jgi:mevalonate kinase
MPPIYINTDNNDKKNKIYNANLTGSAVDAAENKIKEMVIKAFEKEAGFTTAKADNPKGYTIMLKVTTFKASGGDTTCTITGEILRYPKAPSKKGSADEKVMVSRDWSNTATASGKDTAAVLQCIESILELMVPKSIPVMKIDMTRR